MDYAVEQALLFDQAQYLLDVQIH